MKTTKVKAKRPRNAIAAETYEEAQIPSVKRTKPNSKRKIAKSEETSFGSSSRPIIVKAKNKGVQEHGRPPLNLEVKKEVDYEREFYEPKLYAYEDKDWKSSIKNAWGPHDMTTKKWTLDDVPHAKAIDFNPPSPW